MTQKKTRVPHRYTVQLVPRQGLPKERPPFHTQWRKEAFRALFEVVLAECEQQNGTSTILLFEDKRVIAEIRIRN